MRRRFASNTQIVHGPHESLSKMVLPNAIYDYTSKECARAVINVGHPFRQCAPLLRGIRAAAISTRASPVILGRSAFGEHSQEAQLDRLTLRAEIAASQQECFTRFVAIISKSICRGQR